MLAGIGVDIVEIVRFERLLQRYNDRIAQRILTGKEYAQFEVRNRSPAFLALRFAAKEAASKALGSGLSAGVGFQAIEVVNDVSGKPGLVFHAAAKGLIAHRKICRAMLSLSDEKHYAVAMVVLEAD